MKSSKFKVGETVFFMLNNKPVSREVKGISSYDGVIESLHFKKSKNEESFNVLHTGTYEEVKEENAYKSISDLKNHLFDEI